MSKVLVTGASGFIGRTLLISLLEQEYDVIALLRKKNDSLPSGVEQVVYDFDNMTESPSIFRNVDCLIHLAGMAHIEGSSDELNLDRFKEVNTELTLSLARDAAKFGIKRFLFLSSVGVHGTQSNKPFVETDILNPKGEYAISKYMAEKGLFEISKSSKLKIVIIRPPLVYGANAPGNFGRLIRFFNHNFLIPLPLKGIHNKRSMVSVDNLVDFLIVCMTHKNAENETFLVSDNQDISTAQLFREMSKAFNKRLVLFHIPKKIIIWLLSLIGREKDAVRLFSSLQVDISKAQRRLDWQPKLTISEKIRRIAE